MSQSSLLHLDDYPVQLREINDPPERLYLRGTLPPEGTKYLTVVGSRRMSQYAQDVIDHLIAGLAGYPIAIVSGLALGTDGHAHRVAMKHGLTTVALPGSGLGDSVLYPHSHRPLAKQIIDAGGALLSEYPDTEKTHIHYFPARNRIMAGMSDAVLIIEAGVKSGTLITARLATEYNRELLIVPHSIFAEGGAGGHVFMRIGAAPVRTASDILEALKIVEDKPSMELMQLTDEELAVLEALADPIPRDELIRALAIPTGEANVLLAQMEIRGLIAESLGDIRRLV